MKFLFWILLLLPAGLSARTCKLGFGPADTHIRRDAAFLVEACGCPPGTLAELDRGTPAWLVSAEGDSVALRLVVLEDALIQQALLRPAGLLKPGARYALVAPSLLDRPDVDAPTEVRWEVGTEMEESMVGFKAQPRCTMSAKALFGEVPHTIALVDFQPLQATLYWVRVRVQDEWTGDTWSWIEGVSPAQDRFTIGWPTRDCGAGMELIAGVDYTITLTLYGADGAEGRTSDPFRLAVK